MRAVLLLTGVALALVCVGPAAGGRYAIGLERGASADAVAARIEAATGGSVQKIPPFALVLDDSAAAAAAAAGVAGVSYVERLERSRRLAFTPNDPLRSKQWYLGAIHAFDAWPFWPVKPALGSVRVAVIDSGIDGNHPEFEGRIEDAQSFVPDSPNARKDPIGHGTFVAGLIAAELNNSTGIAGIGFPARLLVAKVVRSDGTISPEAEARAIRWAVERGARVINLSLAAFRNPLDPSADQYSPLEEDAIDWAIRQGVVVVAAVGNGEGAPKLPWRYASYPAALPHVIGVGAAAQDGSVPDFSNGDPTFNDLTAPGAAILSTVPRDLSTVRPTCQGYSVCGPDDFRRGDGTSYAAAQVSAAAALLLAQNPSLMPDQVANLLERSADDMADNSGCKRCAAGRDDASGWGMLDIAGALQRAAGELPTPDAWEPNDDTGTRAYMVMGPKRQLKATLDAWDDANDVYRVFLKPGSSLLLQLDGRSVGAALSVWRPGTRTIDTVVGSAAKPLVRVAATAGTTRRVSFHATSKGWHFVQVAAAP
ncbi:MAG: S8 family serine peptidase, partial [Gaiellaceae bacterium]